MAQQVSNVVPESLRAITPIMEGRLETGVTVNGVTYSGSSTAYYLAADPNQVDTVEYAFLEGEEGVKIEQKEGWDIDGVEYKARLDFGAKAIDWRGLAKNAGA
jgi:hypothetical protein